MTKFFQYGSWRTVTVFTFLLLSACAGGEKRRDAPPVRAQEQNTETPTEVPQDGSSGETEQNYGPSRAQNSNLFLVLGPGLIRGFSSVGVIQLLVQEKLPIGGMVGTGVGALIAAVYAHSSTINEFEWTISKFENEIILGSQGFSLSRLLGHKARNEKLKSLLKKVFQDRQLEDLKMPVRIGVYLITDEKPQYYSTGSIADILFVALAEPGILDPAEFEGKKMEALSVVQPFPTSQAREMGEGPVVLVESINAGIFLQKSGNEKQEQYKARLKQASSQSESDIDQADLVIRPDLSQVDYFDFKKRSSAIYQGRIAASKKLSEIKQLIGVVE